MRAWIFPPLQGDLREFTPRSISFCFFSGMYRLLVSCRSADFVARLSDLEYVVI
jgi:hypothetical protein